MPKAPGKFQQIVLREAPGVQAQDIALLNLRADEEDTAIGAGQLQGVRIDPLFRPLFRGGGGIEVVLRLKIKGGDSQTVQGEGGAETCVIPQMSSGETAKSCLTPMIKFLSPTG